MKSAIVYRKGDSLYFHSSCKTTSGMWIATLPLIKMGINSSASAKTEAIVEVLTASKEGVEPPTNWNLVIDPLLKLNGVKSWSTFMKNATCVNLELDGKILKLIPNQNLGSKEGFQPIEEKAVEMPLESSPDQIGGAFERLVL